MCEERIRLVEVYSAAARLLFKAALRLRKLQGEELKTARSEFETNRVECVKVRNALRDHKIDHGCCEMQLTEMRESTLTALNQSDLLPAPDWRPSIHL